MTPGPDRRGELLTALVAVPAGALVGALCTFKHQVGVSAATGSGVPIGLAAALLTVAALLVAVRLSFPTRLPAVAAGVGVLAAVGLLLLPGPSGQDLVVLNGWVGMLWRWGALVVVLGVVVWPRRRRRPRDAGILDEGPPVEA